MLPIDRVRLCFFFFIIFFLEFGTLVTETDTRLRELGSSSARELALAMDALMGALEVAKAGKSENEMEESVRKPLAERAYRREMSEGAAKRAGEVVARGLVANRKLYQAALKGGIEPEERVVERFQEQPTAFARLAKAESEEEWNERRKREEEERKEQEMAKEEERKKEEDRQEEEGERRRKEEEEREQSLGPRSASEIAQMEVKKAFEEERKKLLEEFEAREAQLRERISQLESHQPSKK